MSARDYSLASPDGNVSVTVNVSDSLSFSVRYGDEQILDLSRIALDVKGQDRAFGDRPVIRKASRTSVDRTLEAVVPTKFREVRDCFNELCWLRETDIRLKRRISNIMKAKTCAHNKNQKDEAPELIPCPRCGAPAVLKYRGYLPDYFCSDEKCGNEGGMAETKDDAAYNWNTQKERADFKEAVRKVEYKQFPPQELERLAFLLLGEIMKKEGVIGERD